MRSIGCLIMMSATYALQATYLRSFLRPLSFAALPAITAAALVLSRGRDLTRARTRTSAIAQIQIQKRWKGKGSEGKGRWNSVFISHEIIIYSDYTVTE